jgi:hypothetical protein
MKSVLFSILVCLLLGACAGKPAAETKATTSPETTPAEIATANEEAGKTKTPGSEYMLICKAKKSRFHFDWSATAVKNDQIDQNSVRYKFRSANRPAGEKGENLKVGECGWAGRALANTKKENSEVVMKTLSDEATQAFAKMRTGKVFKLPVRRSKAGMVALPRSEVSIVR